MSIINKLSTLKDRNDEELNIIVAGEIANSENKQAIEELVENLNNKDSNIASDCIKTLYEIGYLKPELISNYATNFLNLLNSKNNRLVWGAMIALQTIALLSPKEIWERRGEIINFYDKGSVITKDNAIKILAKLSSINKEYEERLFSQLLEYLKEIRIQSFCQYAESVAIAVNDKNKDKFLEILKFRNSDLNETRKKRIERLVKQINKDEKH